MRLTTLALSALGLVGAFACSEQILQTALNGTLAPGPGGSTGSEGGAPGAEFFSCAESPGGDTEPNAAQGGSRSSWAFVGGDYGASQGPGIAVVARDSFQLYVNGELLLERGSTREPAFVPVLLPPGDNVIALSVSADSGTPGALIHVDELERAVVSDRDWKFELRPTGNWMSTDYDDDDWGPATELASLGDAPGCDPMQDFPSSSNARWIGPPLGSEGTVVLRTRIRIAPEGFGADAVGGEGAEPQVVSDWAQLQALALTDEPKMLLIPQGIHDFRRKGTEITDQEVCPSQCPNDATKTRYAVLVGTATCPDPLVLLPRDDRILRLGSNTTLMGLGRGAALRGVTLDFQDSEQLIVRNIALFDINPEMSEAGDAFSLFKPSHVWIDHGTAQWVSDGFTDLRTGSSDVTISYMRYDGRSETACEGRHDRASLIDGSEATIHHSRFDHVAGSAPIVKAAGARVHLYNNSYANLSDWAIGSSCQAAVLAEGNTFENVEAIGLTTTCGSDMTLGFLDFPAGSNLYRDGAPLFLTGDGSEPHESGFTPPYEYDLQTASDAWPVVISRAGAGGPWALPLSLD